VIAAAYLLDWIAGDPEWFPHPVRCIGASVHTGERWLRRPGQTAAEELLAGAALTLGVVGASYWGATKASGILEIVLGWTCLASRNLVDESLAVLRATDLPDARERLARIVGRDTHSLSETEIYRALIETLAESACDGIVAPMFYMTLGGVPLAMAYKAINTLDSMIGHADERYFYFGKVAARLDDAANYLPARLTALLIATAAGRKAPSAFSTWRRDGGNHKSPNAGQPESAMAGALQVRLGGSNTYAGELIASPLLGAEFAPPTLGHARRALRIVTAVSLLSLALSSCVSCWSYSRRSRSALSPPARPR
jgi:adenosylcobinamide-phosphate synthase